MYVTTFYSFKGGVGRTMALVNSGVELAKRGRKVLLVDFDLEAPGLDTFEAVKPKKTAPGIVRLRKKLLGFRTGARGRWIPAKVSRYRR